MSNKEWDSATSDERLELLRSDIQQISEYHNSLAREFRQQMIEVRQEIEALKRIRPKI